MLSITALLPVLQCSASVDGGVVLPAFMCKGLNLVNLLDKVSAVGLTKKQFLLEPECGVCCGLRYHAAMHRDRRMCPYIYYFGPLDPFGDLQNWALQRWRATLVIFKLDFIISSSATFFAPSASPDLNPAVQHGCRPLKKTGSDFSLPKCVKQVHFHIPSVPPQQNETSALQ